MNTPPALHQRLFIESLRDQLSRCASAAVCVSLVHFSVDDFPSMIERVGQLAAQGTLGVLARVLAELSSQRELCLRSGSGQFFVALPGFSLAAAIEFAERARLRIANFNIAGSVSVGVVQTGPMAPLDPLALVDTACRLVEQSCSLGGGHLVATTT